MSKAYVCSEEDNVCRLVDAVEDISLQEGQATTTATVSLGGDGDSGNIGNNNSEADNNETQAISTVNDGQSEDTNNPKEDREEGSSNPRRNKKKKNGNHNSKSVISKVHSQQDLDRMLNSNNEDDDEETPQLFLVEFVTTWCGACKSIQSLYEDLAVQNLDTVSCSQVVCDKNKETKKLADSYKVRSYPVFVVFDNNTGSEINRWEGADTGKLEKVFDYENNPRGRKGGGGGKSKKKGGAGGGKKRR